ncbi:FHA domain-containing protein [Cellulomonas sp. 179-A 4D5 NHS]|uniref:FHA domain-containing protein n=1 Tax=Cellulomonas sp. 179-A 4D5 NHS TaxID=3142378 RepID=UPI0039A048E7
MRAFTAVDPPRTDAPSALPRAPVPTTVLFHGVVLAETRRTWALVVDAGVVVLALAVGLLVTPLLGLVLPVAALLGVVAGLVRHGRTPGHRLLRLRTVDARTGLPGSPLALLPTRGVTADLVRGRDPLQVVPSALTPVSRSTAPRSADPWAAGSRRPATVVLLTDDGSVLQVTGPTIVGRSPVDPTGAHRLLGIPDLSRSISRSHALLEPHGASVWVTDLGSANGTAVALPGEPLVRLAPNVRVEAPVGARLALGDRVVHLAQAQTAERASTGGRRAAGPGPEGAA